MMEILERLKQIKQLNERLGAEVEDLLGILAEKATAAAPDRVRYCAPVGTEAERDSGQIWPIGWVDATGFCRWYAFGWHTGVDLNLNSPHWDADRHRPVYSIADGEIYAVRTGVQGWATVICIRHAECLSRYAHCEDIQVAEGQPVARGQFLGRIGNAEGRYPYHLHFDIARLEARMADYPLDWPGTAKDAKARVLKDYLDPAAFLRSGA